MEEFKVMDSLVENFNNASDNAIEEIKDSYRLQDIAKESHYTISEIKELHRAVNNVDTVEVLVKSAEETKVNLFDVLKIHNITKK